MVYLPVVWVLIVKPLYFEDVHAYYFKLGNTQQEVDNGMLLHVLMKGQLVHKLKKTLSL